MRHVHLKDYWHVYQLHSVGEKGEVYTGYTQDLDSRLKDHNRGHCPHTDKFRPWQLEVAIAFRSKAKAIAFERYLKSGSGREFARRHF
jgi:predicted GIY-YIG superfamily endonuclease